MPPPPQTKRALIVVRTYPTPAKTGVEVSCTAAITDKGEWLRLFPVPWRFFDEDKRFRKYQWVDVEVTKASDSRPESHKLRLDGSGITILGDPLPTKNGWKARKDIVSPLMSLSLCHLQKKRDADLFPTLGVFRPKKIERLIIAEDDPEWSQSQMAILSQKNLFIEPPKNQLEKIPFIFKYRFTCDDPDCINGHTLSCTDWEMGQSYRRWKKEYGADWEAAFRNRYEKEMIDKYDTHFFVGTVHQHPGSWIIVGLFYPPKMPEPEAMLF